MIPASGAQPADEAKLDIACAKAMELQLAGQLDLARRLYAGILQTAPRHAAANYCLGMLHVQLQRPIDGLPHLLSALQSKPAIADYWLGYLEGLILLDRLDTAHNILTLGRRTGLAGPAVEDFARRLEARRARAEHTARGSTAPTPAVPVPNASSGPPPRARKGRHGGRRDVQREEGSLLSMVERRQFADALTLARDLTRRHPERGLGWKILGAVMPTESGYDEAIEVLQRAVRLMPKDAEAHVNLGMTLAKAKRFEEAEKFLRKSLAIDPNLAAAHYRLGMAYEFQGRYAEAEASLRRGRAVGLRANTVAGDDELSYSHLLFLMGHNPTVDAKELFAEHRRYGEYFESRLRPTWPLHANDRSPGRCLKVGFVSGDLYEHSVSKFLEPIVDRLMHRPSLELHAYYNNTIEDAVSRRLTSRFKTWNPVCDLSDAKLAAKIIDDRIDVLIDLSGHTGQTRLPVFARKPAPVQVSWLGYPGTTGLRAMDYYLADEKWLPFGQFDHLFTEQLVYLPDRWAFQLHPLTPAVGPLPALTTGRLTFGSFHRLGKINSSTIDLWSQLLLALPHTNLIVAGIPLDGPQQALLRQFTAQGIAAERLTFHGRSTMDLYLALHNQVDIALDTQPYAGGTTTMYSLSMGVPTLTVAGATSVARAGAGIHGQLGLEQFVAANPGRFVELGCYWADHLHELAQLRSGMRERMSRSPGGQPPLIAAHLEAALRHMWRRWCEGLPPHTFRSCTSE